MSSLEKYFSSYSYVWSPYSGSCKTPSEVPPTKIIFQIGSLLEEIKEISFPVTNAAWRQLSLPVETLFPFFPASIPHAVFLRCLLPCRSWGAASCSGIEPSPRCLSFLFLFLFWCDVHLQWLHCISRIGWLAKITCRGETQLLTVHFTSWCLWPRFSSWESSVFETEGTQRLV